MRAAMAFANEHPSGTELPLLRLVPAEAGLSAAERQAAEVGRTDAFRYGWDAGLARATWRRHLVALVSRVTGLRGVTPLADGRLEKIRLFAAMMRRDDRRLHTIADELIAEGLSRTALRQVIDVALS
jgi:hypothetical protein